MTTTWWAEEDANGDVPGSVIALDDTATDELGEIPIPLDFLQMLLEKAGYRQVARTEHHKPGRHAAPTTPAYDLLPYLDQINAHAKALAATTRVPETYVDEPHPSTTNTTALAVYPETE